MSDDLKRMVTEDHWQVSALEQMIARGRPSRKGEVSPHHRWIVDALMCRGEIANRATPPHYELVVTEAGRARIEAARLFRQPPAESTP